MRSVVVVLPASMWAMMPIFLVRFRSCFAISTLLVFGLRSLTKTKAPRPSYLKLVMRKRLVGIRHAMRIFLFLYRVAAVIGRVKNLAGEPVSHRFFAATARVRNNPADRQGAAPFLMHLYRHLIRGTANPSRLNFDGRLHVIDCAFENLQRSLAGLLADLLHRAVENDFSDRFLPAPHNAVDKLRYQRARVNRIRKYFSSFCNSSSWHNPSNFGLRISNCELEIRNPNFEIRMFIFLPPLAGSLRISNAP